MAERHCGFVRTAIPRAAARSADLDAAAAPAILSRCRAPAANYCRTSSPSATSRAASPPRCAPATSASCGRACPTPHSSGARIASSRSRRACPASTRSHSRPSSAPSATKCGACVTLAGEIALLIDADRAKAERAAQPREVRPAVIHGRRISRAAGNHGPVLRRSPMASPPMSPRPSTSTIYRAAPAAHCRRPAPVLPWRWPTSSTRWPESSPSARSRAAPRILSVCVARPLARCASSPKRSFDVDLRALVTRACALQPVQNAGAAGEVWEYMVERLRAYFLDSGSAGGVADVTTEMFDAVRASSPVSPLDFAARLAALAKFLEHCPRQRSLTAANKRISNILKKADARHGGHGRCRRAARACREGVARSACGHRRRRSSARSPSATTAQHSTRLATLRPAVDGFFDGVMVNAEDPALRRNRLALLAQVRHHFARIADLSCLPG